MDNGLQKFKKFSKEMKTYHNILGWFRNILLIAAFGSNLVVCTVMMKTKDHRKTLSKFFIFHLAITDIAFRILECYELITEKVNNGVLSSLHCKIIVFFQYVCAAVLFSLLSGIALDRSKNIIYPLQSLRRKTCNHGMRTVFLIWLYAITISATFFYSATSMRFTSHFNAIRSNSTHGISDDTHQFSDTLTFRSPRTHCLVGQSASLRSQISFTIYFCCGFFVPLCIMGSCYSRVFYFLTNRARHSVLNRSVIKSKWKTVFILMLLVLSFLVSWAPIMMLDLIASFVRLGKGVEQKLRPVAEVLCLSSSILNPFIYAFGNASFRKQAVSLFFCKRKLAC